ncbi:DUF927 domain-containing protein [Methylocystis sp. Sn-Cys]|uniref:DUF927 domain-containing protein n=1 Tax=Methylocystis sp. Sn-Cys TaxID=1701263 RepID=UPI0019250DCC|nr:DUF927 domain-containing protein [Methylocystis sp. Sn-Cys]MBL1258008.1 DUF927 domain-containing protein [Methylocystis sp. Sn-Cys]
MLDEKGFADLADERHADNDGGAPEEERRFISQYPYSMGSDGLYVEVIAGPAGKKQPKELFVSAPFEILGRCRDPHGDNWGALIRWYDDDGKAHTRHVADEAIHRDRNALCAELAREGLRIHIDQHAAFVGYLNAIRVKKRITIVRRTGWHEIAGRHVFVLPDETIGNTDEDLFPGTCAGTSQSPGGTAEQVEQVETAEVGDKKSFERIVLDGPAIGPYEARGTLEEWKAGVGKLMQGHALAVFATSAAFAGPLLHLVGEGDGGIHLLGPSSIGKSAIENGLASVWGKGDTRGGFVRTWRATPNGLEGVAEAATDTCLVLDELGVGDPREVGQIVYQISNGQGKARASRDGSARKTKDWRVFVISSGEISIEEKIKEDRTRKPRAGQLVRFLDIPADQGKGFGVFDHGGADDNAAQIADALKRAAVMHYGTAGPEFVRQIIRRGVETVAATARRFLDDFCRRQTPKGADGQVGRAVKIFGLAAAAGELATDFQVTPWRRGEATKAAERALGKWLERRGGSSSYEERQYIETLRRFLEAHGASKFERHPKQDHYTAVDCFGWVESKGEVDDKGQFRKDQDGNEIKQTTWFIPSESWKRIFEGLDTSEAAKSLARMGVVKRGSDAIQVSKSLGGKKRRVYEVSDKIFDD